MASVRVHLRRVVEIQRNGDRSRLLSFCALNRCKANHRTRSKATISPGLISALKSSSGCRAASRYITVTSTPIPLRLAHAHIFKQYCTQDPPRPSSTLLMPRDNPQTTDYPVTCLIRLSMYSRDETLEFCGYGFPDRIFNPIKPARSIPQALVHIDHFAGSRSVIRLFTTRFVSKVLTSARFT